MIQGCCPYREGEICTRHQGKMARGQEKWSDVQEAEDSGRPHKLGEAEGTCLEYLGGTWPHLGL